MRRPLLPPSLAEGESPRLAVAIQHVEARAHLLPRLRDALGSGWQAVDVVIGDPELRSPWETYRRCLELAGPFRPGVGAPAPAPTRERFGDSATHLLVIQDDALPVARFYERVAEAVSRRPDDLVCLYTPEHPAYMGRAIKAAARVLPGGGFAQLPNGMFVPLVATVWPVGEALDVLGWWQAQAPGTAHKRCDDAQVARWLRARKRHAWGTAPCLADHDEAEPSTLGLGRYRRHAAVLAPD